MPDIFHKKVQGFTKSEAEVLEFFGSRVDKEEGTAAVRAKTQWMHDVISGVTKATPKEVVKSLNDLAEFNFFVVYGKNDTDGKVMYEITNAGLAAYAKVKAESQVKACSRYDLKCKASSLLRTLRG